MPVPALVSALVSSVVGAIADAPSPASVDTAAAVVQTFGERKFPAGTKIGKMQPPLDGFALIDGGSVALSPVLQVRNAQNLIVLPVNVQDAATVCYLLDANGAVARIWLLSANEIASLPSTVSTDASP